MGVPDASYFDFPILKPGQTVTSIFDLSTASGLYGLKINDAAKDGQTDSGIFTIRGEWWSGDPLSGGTFIQNAVLQFAPFSVLVSSCGSYLGSQIGTGKCIESGTMTVDVTDQNVTGTLDVRSKGGNVDSNGINGTVSGVIRGAGGLTKVGLGKLTLTGGNAYLGGTTINQGTLAVNGSLASGVTVNTDGILRGTGVVNGNTSVAGRLAPGNSPGTLTVNGSVSMASSSKLEIDVDGTGTGNGAGNYSRVLVQGAGNVFAAAGELQPILRGITGNANNTFTPVIGQSFQVVTATGGVKGTFSSLTQPIAGLPTGTRFDALYDANAVRLAVTPKFYSDLPNIDLKGNSSAVGVVLDTVRPASFESKNSVFQALAIQSEPQVASTLQQMDGEIHADLLTASFNAHRLTRQDRKSTRLNSSH